MVKRPDYQILIVWVIEIYFRRFNFMAVRKKKKPEEQRTETKARGGKKPVQETKGKKVSDRFTTQEAPMTKPGKTDTSRGHVLTAREIAEIEQEKKRKKKAVKGR